MAVKLYFRIALNLALVAAFFLIAEGVAEKCYRPRPVQAHPDSETFWRLENIRFPTQYPYPRQRPGQFKVICFGDSNVAGCPNTEAESLPLQLQAALRRRGIDAIVYNAACPGFTSWQVEALYSEYCARYQPDDDLILVHVLCNDSNREFITDAERAKALERQRALREGLSRFALYELLRGILLPARESGPGKTFRVPPAEFVQHLAAIQARAREHGASFAYVSLPTTREQGVAFKAKLPHLPVPEIRLDQDAKLRACLLETIHFSAAGHRLISEAVAGWIEGQGIVGKKSSLPIKDQGMATRLLPPRPDKPLGGSNRRPEIHGAEKITPNLQGAPQSLPRATTGP